MTRCEKCGNLHKTLVKKDTYVKVDTLATGVITNIKLIKKELLQDDVIKSSRYYDDLKNGIQNCLTSINLIIGLVKELS